MAFAIHKHDKPGSRDQRRAAHHACLEPHCHRLIASGGLRDDAGTEMLGGLIIIDADTVEAAHQFVAADPFTLQTRSRRSISFAGKSLSLVASA